MNKSVILQVDDSTKGLVEEIQNGITDSIENGMQNVSEELVKGNKEILSKFVFMGKSVNELRDLVEQSKDLTGIVNPLQEALTKIVIPLQGKVDELKSGISEENEKIKETLNSVISEDKTIQTELDRIKEKLEKTEDEQEKLKEKIDDLKSTIERLENDSKESSEKVMSALQIVVNLVAPFWKKINIEEEMGKNKS
jgi:chromosome segregation ATPase